MDKEREEALRLWRGAKTHPVRAPQNDDEFPDTIRLSVKELIELIRLARQSAPQGKPNLSWPICPTCGKPCETFSMTGCIGGQQHMPSRSFIMRGNSTYHLGCEPREAAPPAQPDVVRDALLQGFVMVPRVLPQVVLDGFIKTGQQYSRAWAELLLKFWEHALDAALNHQSPLKNEAS